MSAKQIGGGNICRVFSIKHCATPSANPARGLLRRGRSKSNCSLFLPLSPPLMLYEYRRPLSPLAFSLARFAPSDKDRKRRARREREEGHAGHKVGGGRGGGGHGPGGEVRHVCLPHIFLTRSLFCLLFCIFPSIQGSKGPCGKVAPPALPPRGERRRRWRQRGSLLFRR